MRHKKNQKESGLSKQQVRAIIQCVDDADTDGVVRYSIESGVPRVYSREEVQSGVAPKRCLMTTPGHFLAYSLLRECSDEPIVGIGPLRAALGQLNNRQAKIPDARAAKLISIFWGHDLDTKDHMKRIFSIAPDLATSRALQTGYLAFVAARTLVDRGR